jgi:hypothetical protein
MVFVADGWIEVVLEKNGPWTRVVDDRLPNAMTVPEAVIYAREFVYAHGLAFRVVDAAGNEVERWDVRGRP